MVVNKFNCSQSSVHSPPVLCGSNRIPFCPCCACGPCAGPCGSAIIFFNNLVFKVVQEGIEDKISVLDGYDWRGTNRRLGRVPERIRLVQCVRLVHLPVLMVRHNLKHRYLGITYQISKQSKTTKGFWQEFLHSYRKRVIFNIIHQEEPLFPGYLTSRGLIKTKSDLSDVFMDEVALFNIDEESARPSLHVVTHDDHGHLAASLKFRTIVKDVIMVTHTFSKNHKVCAERKFIG